MRAKYIGKTVMGFFNGGEWLVEGNAYEVATDFRARNGCLVVYDENNIMQPIDASKFIVEEE